MLKRRRRNKYWKVTYIDSSGREQVKYYSSYSQTEAERRLDTLSSFDRVVKSEEITYDDFLKNKDNRVCKSSKKWEVEFKDKDGVVYKKVFNAEHQSTCVANVRRKTNFCELISINEVA
jgi:hypothetical protein